MSVFSTRVGMILVACLAAVSGSEDQVWSQSVTVRLWQDLPSEVLIELNTHLPTELRFAWYVDPALDADLYPGTTLELADQSLSEVLDAYCAAAGLNWRRQGRVAWIYRDLDDARLQELRRRLHGDDQADRIAARNDLLANNSPASLGVLLQALAAEDDHLATIALQGLHEFLHSSPDWGHGVRAGFALFGDPDWRRNAVQPFLMYHMDIPAPWAALMIAAEDQAVAEAIATTVTRHQDEIGRHLALALAAVCARLPQAAEIALAPWLDAGSGWQWNYINGRARAARAHAGQQADQEELPPLAEQRSALTVAISAMGEGNRNERRQAQRNAETIVRRIGRHGDAAARDALLSVAVDGNNPESVRRAALGALADLADSILVDPLIALHDQVGAESAVARAAVDVLQTIDDPRARDFCLPALTSDIAGQISRLDTIGDENQRNRLFDNIRRRMEDVGAARGTLPVTILGALLRDSNTPQDLRRVACDILANHRHPDMVGPLVHAYNHDEWPDVRRSAAMALGRSRLPAAIEALRQGLADRDSLIARQSAAQALALSRHPDSFDVLVPMIEGIERSAERIVLIQNLGITRNPKAADLLIAILNDVERAIADRLAAASALSLVPTAPARAALVEIIKGDHDLHLQRQTMDALTPRTQADVPIFTPLLVELLESRPRQELLRMVVSHLRRCMVGLPPGDPRKALIEGRVLELVSDHNADNNARREGLDVFQYSEEPAIVADRLEPVRDQERNPVMRSFLVRAIKSLRDRAP